MQAVWVIFLFLFSPPDREPGDPHNDWSLKSNVKFDSLPLHATRLTLALSIRSLLIKIPYFFQRALMN